MLITLQEILAFAEEKSCAIGAFNGPNLPSVRGVLEAAESLQAPVILMHAQVHESVMPLDIIAPILVRESARASVPVCVHLDHGVDIPYLQRALDFGFTSVMYDGSLLPFDENIRNTQEVVRMAAQKGASVEAEFGIMHGSEGEDSGEEGGESCYTDPDQAKVFADQTGIDALACSFGTVHGIYRREPKLDFDRVAAIRRKTGMPIVMHGGSGISLEDYRRVIARGVRKINYYTYMALAATQGIQRHMAEFNGTARFEIVEEWAREAIYEDIRKTIAVFSESQPRVE